MPQPRRRWLALTIGAALAIDYATILRVEIFAEMRAGRSFADALTQGNGVLTAIGVAISVVGVAAILYLALDRRE